MAVDSYGAKKNRSQNAQNTELNTNSFRQVNNAQEDSNSPGINWSTGKDLPRYWSSKMITQGSNQSRDYSIDSGYCEWSPGNRFPIGSTIQEGTQPVDLDKGASSRYCYQWQRVGGVVTGSGRVQLGVNGGDDGTSATWLIYGDNTDAGQNQALLTSYDKADNKRLDGNFSIATIPLPVYYQTNVDRTNGTQISPPMGSRADIIIDPTLELNATTAAALEGAKFTYDASYPTNSYIGGSGTAVGTFWNDIGEEGYWYRLYYADGTLNYAFQEPPSGNVTGVVHFTNTGSQKEYTTAVKKYMNIIVKGLLVPDGSNATGAATNMRNYSGTNLYTGDSQRYILPPVYHFTFSYVLGGYQQEQTIT